MGAMKLRTVALVAGCLALGASAGLAGASLLDEEEAPPVAPIAVPASKLPDRRAPRIVVDDGVPAGAAGAIAAAAAEHARGRALSVDTDNGRYEVTVQRPDGAIVEVVLDGRRVVRVRHGDGDGTVD